MRNGDCRIVHREFIQDVVAGAGTPSVFNDVSLPVNPGQTTTFPWLSSIAGRFESYQFRKLKFCYETEAPSSLGGTLVLSLDYDASDPSPTSKQQALAYRNAVRSAPWTTCCHSSDLEDLSKQKSQFVRPAGQPVGTDIKMYDTGNLNVISQGVTTAGATLGELYVEYDVLLMTPVLENFSQSGFAGSAASAALGAALIAPITFGGSLPITLSGPTATVSGAQIGAEYSLNFFAGTGGATASLAIGAGITLKNSLVSGGAAAVALITVIATNSTFSFTATATTGGTDPLIQVVLLSPSPPA